MIKILWYQFQDINFHNINIYDINFILILWYQFFYSWWYPSENYLRSYLYQSHILGFFQEKNVNDFVFSTECSFVNKFRIFFFLKRIFEFEFSTVASHDIFNSFFLNFKHLCQRSTNRFELINLEELASFEKKLNKNEPSEKFWTFHAPMRKKTGEAKYQCVQKANACTSVSYLCFLESD